MADDIERLAALVEVVRRLRAPDGCPWDREQTPASLRATMLEEAYEVLEAIDEKSMPKLREELGDVLLQVLMQSAIAEETGEFTLGEVAETVREKLVRRHPHVFGSTVVSGSDEVVRNWEALKAKEYGRESALDGVQRSTRYPGGVALRFARVKRYRDDKTAADADTIDAVRQLLP